MPSIAWRTLFFMWLCLLLALPSSLTHCWLCHHKIPHILSSFKLNNQPITLLHPWCIHFSLSKILISIWPSHAEYHTCSPTWASSMWYFQHPKKTPLMHDCSVTLFLSLFGFIVLDSAQHLYSKAYLCFLYYFCYTHGSFSLSLKNKAIISVSFHLYPHHSLTL